MTQTDRNTMPITSTAHAELDYEEPSDYGVNVEQSPAAGDEQSPQQSLAGERLRAIAGIHAYANWLAAHPDVPVPTSLDGHVHQRCDFDESVRVVRAFVDTYGAEKHTNTGTGWAILRVSAADSPVKVEHCIFTATNREKSDWL